MRLLKNKKGYISIEVIVVAAFVLLLATGGIKSFSAASNRVMENAINQLNGVTSGGGIGIQ